MSGVTVCLWFNGKAEEAARFYEATIPDTTVTAVRRSPADYPAGRAGDVLVAEFTVQGTSFIGLNGGPEFTFDEAVSFQIDTADQAETDRLWAALTADGGRPGECSWLKDKYGVSWQIVPRQLTEGMNHPDPAVAKRVMEAMMTLSRIDVAAIERAASGQPEQVARTAGGS